MEQRLDSLSNRRRVRLIGSVNPFVHIDDRLKPAVGINGRINYCFMQQVLREGVHELADERVEDLQRCFRFASSRKDGALYQKAQIARVSRRPLLDLMGKGQGFARVTPVKCQQCQVRFRNTSERVRPVPLPKCFERGFQRETFVPGRQQPPFPNDMEASLRMDRTSKAWFRLFCRRAGAGYKTHGYPQDSVENQGSAHGADDANESGAQT